MTKATQNMKKYFEKIEKEVDGCYVISNKARSLLLDPSDKVEIKLARNMVERVEGLIGVVAPQLVGSGVTERIHELEKQYSPMDWRVALKIALDVAQQKFCKFESKLKAMEVGIRTGFAYQTGGIVAAPLEGFVELKIKKTRAGHEYFAPYYAGPIRGAGGTAAAFSLLITDYVRVHMGYAKYDPSDEEVNRYKTEVADYHDRITNLQYLPSQEELDFLLRHIPIEVDGDPTEKITVSNYLDLDRIPTNRIRGGICLVLAEGLAQKSPKIWKRLEKWGKEMGLEWDFLNEFLKLQKKIKAKKSVTKSDGKKEKLTPNYTFIADLVAGRPVLTYPMKTGGFRLRYGRTRLTGFSAAGINPATFNILNSYVATGTQLKVERPGKAAAITPCDSIRGPAVVLDDGSFIKINTVSEAKQYKNRIKKVVFLGDILFNYGDFSENGHFLVPPGYNEEWWSKELRQGLYTKYNFLDTTSLSKETNIQKEELDELCAKPLKKDILFSSAILLSKTLNIPLHPLHTLFWKLIDYEQLNYLVDSFTKVKFVKSDDGTVTKLIFPMDEKLKLIFESLCLFHTVASNEFLVVKSPLCFVLLFSLNINNREEIEKIKIQIEQNKEKPVLEIISSLSGVVMRDMAGTFIGARMGRPEKAKMRKMTGSPQVLFPVGEEGGRLRCFQSALEKGKITAQFSIFKCESCNKETVYRSCEVCGKKTKKVFFCRTCGVIDDENCSQHGTASPFKPKEIDIKHYFQSALNILGDRTYPDLIKGVRGTSNKDHTPEHLVKGILRAKHNIYVNKDGTVRFDMSELPITHFKPSEIGVSVEKLKELGYEKDINGQDITDSQQIIEIKPQDIIIPAATDALDEQADLVIVRVAKFIDELLVKVYKQEAYYNVKTRDDLVGHLILGLAPHISAGMVGRIIGFSNTQGFLSHPMFHAAMRRDCFDYNTFLPLFIDNSWQIVKLGEFVKSLNLIDVIDNFGTKEIKVKNMKTVGQQGVVSINNFTKHTPQPMVKIKTASGKELKTTFNHKHIVFDEKDKTGNIVKANDLKLGDKVALPYKLNIPKRDILGFDLLDIFSDQDWVMVRGVNKHYDVRRQAKEYFNKRDYDNFTRRDSYPIKFVFELKKKGIVSSENLFVGAKRDHVIIPANISLDKELLQLIGLYVAEGYSRKVKARLYQVYIAAENIEIRSFIRSNIKRIFGLSTTENKKDRLTYSSRILYFFFTQILKCGSSAYEKRIPGIFLNLPNKKLGYLLSGYFEGDGSVSKSDLRVSFDTVSEGLLKDLDFIFGQMGIFVKNYNYKSLPGGKVKEFYIKKNRSIPEFEITKGIIQSIFVKQFAKHINFISKRKKEILRYLLTKKARRIKQKYDSNIIYDEIVSVELLSQETSYCLNVDNNKVVANSILTKQCDGDEASLSLLLDATLNFSRHCLPNRRGASTMDAPLVLTSNLIPSEVDDQAHGLDVVWEYPLELYEAALEYKNPWDVKIEQINRRLNTIFQYEGMGYTHSVFDLNNANSCSAYKSLPSMAEKLAGQMDIAVKLNAVDEADVARLVIDKHFLKDLKGNLRKFSQQSFRCVKCNEIFRRTPLIGKCSSCGGKIIFTISEGSVIKYLNASVDLATNYSVPNYVKQTIMLLQQRIEGVFGKDKEKQEGLGKWFG